MIKKLGYKYRIAKHYQTDPNTSYKKTRRYLSAFELIKYLMIGFNIIFIDEMSISTNLAPKKAYCKKN